MKKTLVIIILLLIAFTGFWYYKAEEAKNLVASHLKEWEKPNENGYRLRYENISVGGYPLSYEVSVSNPRYAKEKTTDQSQIFVDGKIVFGTNLWGSKYWIDRFGDLNILLNDEKSKKDNQHVVIGGTSKIKMVVQNPQIFVGLMHPFQAFPKELYSQEFSFSNWWKNVHEGELEVRHMTLLNAENSQVLMKLEKGDIDWKKSFYKEGIVNIILNFDLKGLEGLEKIESLSKAISPTTQTKLFKSGTLPTLFSPGKTDLVFEGEATFNERMNFEDFLELPPVSFKLKKMEISNNFGESKLKSSLEVEQKAKGKFVHFDFSSSSVTTKEGYENMVNDFILALKNSAKEGSQPTDAKVKKLLECCEDDLKKVVPRYDELGKTNLNIDFDVKIAKDRETSKELIDLNVKHFDFTADPYGFLSHGDINWADTYPEGKFVIDLENYNRMIHDISNYYNGIQPLLPVLLDEKPQNVPPKITETKIEQFLQFLQYISDEPKEKDLTITIHFPGNENVTIGKRTLPEVGVALEKLSKEEK